MKISSAIDTHLKPSELPAGYLVRLTIASCEQEVVAGQDRPVLRFASRNRGLVLNQHLAVALTEAFGEDTDAWVGREIDLWAEDVPARAPHEIIIKFRIRPVEPRHDEWPRRQQKRKESAPTHYRNAQF